MVSTRAAVISVELSPASSAVFAWVSSPSVAARAPSQQPFHSPSTPIMSPISGIGAAGTAAFVPPAASMNSIAGADSPQAASVSALNTAGQTSASSFPAGQSSRLADVATAFLIALLMDSEKGKDDSSNGAMRLLLGMAALAAFGQSGHCQFGAAGGDAVQAGAQAYAAQSAPSAVGGGVNMTA